MHNFLSCSKGVLFIYFTRVELSNLILCLGLHQCAQWLNSAANNNMQFKVGAAPNAGSASRLLFLLYDWHLSL